MLVFKQILRVAPIVAGLVMATVSVDEAGAHTTTIGYTNAGAGAVSFWYGSYHQGVPFNEGQINLSNGGSYNSTVYFNLLTSTKPAGLVDGTNNFYSTGVGLTGTPTRTIYAWQGATFIGLSAGTYTFNYVPFPANQPNPNQGGVPGPTVEWVPRAPDVLSNNTC